MWHTWRRSAFNHPFPLRHTLSQYRKNPSPSVRDVVYGRSLKSLCEQWTKLVSCVMLYVKHSTANALIRGWRRSVTRVHCVKMLSVVVTAMPLQQPAKHNHCCKRRMRLNMPDIQTPVKCGPWSPYLTFWVGSLLHLPIAEAVRPYQFGSMCILLSYGNQRSHKRLWSQNQHQSWRLTSTWGVCLSIFFIDWTSQTTPLATYWMANKI